MKNKMKKPVAVPVNKLHPFDGNPYKVIDNDEMDTLVESIQNIGITNPLIVRPIENTEDEYEVISGHRRLYASKKAGLEEVPAFIYAIDRDEAAVMLVDSNLHRERILPSEKAFAYKMKSEALKHQGITCGQLGHKSRDDVSDTESGRNVQRYIRLTNLIPELLEMMDEGKIALSVGVELSYLDDERQYDILNMCEVNDCTPSFSQATRMHKLSGAGELDDYAVAEIMNEQKANQKTFIKISEERAKGLIPSGYFGKQAEDYVVKALEHYSKYLKKQKDYSR